MTAITAFVSGQTALATRSLMAPSFFGIMPVKVPPRHISQISYLDEASKNTRFNQVLRAAFIGKNTSSDQEASENIGKSKIKEISKADDEIIFKQIVADIRPKFESFIRENPGKRFIVTLDGPPGSGKESVALGLYKALGELCGTFRLEVDGFLYDRETRVEIARDKGFTTNKFCTGDELRGNLLQEVVTTLSQIIKGQFIECLQYTRNPDDKKIDGTLQPSRISVSEKELILLVDGSHASKLESVHYKVFLDISPERNKEMRLGRDMRSRNTGSLEELEREAESAVEQSQEHIIPNKQYADMLVKWGDKLNDKGHYRLELVGRPEKISL